MREQIVVERQDAIPAGVPGAFRFGMHRRERSLHVIATHAPAFGAALEVGEAERDELSIPQRPILILQEHDLPVAVDATRQPGSLECHQRHQGVCVRRSVVRLARDRELWRHRNETSKAQRLSTDVVPNQRFAGVRLVAFVEEQVDDFKH